MGTNNKLREAVKKLLDVLYDMGVDENTLAIAIESPNCQMKSEYTLSVLKEARAALAAPPRNCDAHTADELKAIFKSELISELPIANEHEKNLVAITAMGVIDTLFAHATEKKGESDGSK